MPPPPPRSAARAREPASDPGPVVLKRESTRGVIDLGLPPFLAGRKNRFLGVFLYLKTKTKTKRLGFIPKRRLLIASLVGGNREPVRPRATLKNGI